MNFASCVSFDEEFATVWWYGLWPLPREMPVTLTMVEVEGRTSVNEHRFDVHYRRHERKADTFPGTSKSITECHLPPFVSHPKVSLRNRGSSHMLSDCHNTKSYWAHFREQFKIHSAKTPRESISRDEKLLFSPNPSANVNDFDSAPRSPRRTIKLTFEANFFTSREHISPQHIMLIDTKRLLELTFDAIKETFGRRGSNEAARNIKNCRCRSSRQSTQVQ